MLVALLLVAAGLRRTEAGRDWDGFDPFWQPVDTTDYYGSGDLDLDGKLTDADLTIVRRIVVGQSSPFGRADVDGNGVVDASDEVLLASALKGGLLPAWWDRLESRESRREWVFKMLERDPTDRHPYTPSWLQCVGFSTQLYLRFSSYHGELFASDFGAGQTVYNLPFYCVSVMSDQVSHAVNAVLVGDDPLRFGDWLFVEPQNDRELLPGSALFPYGATVSIYVPRDIQAVGQGISNRVEFVLQSSGALLKQHDPSLVLRRGAPPERIPQNVPNLWEPHLIRSEVVSLLAERSRDDLGSVSDLHFCPRLLPLSADPASLTGSPQMSRPLDETTAGDTFVLWKGEPNYSRSLLWGRLDPQSGRLLARGSVATDRCVFGARMVVAASNHFHVVWLEPKWIVSHPYEAGLYWSQWKGSEWSKPERIVAIGQDIDSWHFEAFPDARRYFFDAALNAAGELVVVWARRQTLLSGVEVSEVRYAESWTEPRVVAQLALPTCGVDLLADSSGDLHLVYWNGYSQQTRSEGRGPLWYRSMHGANWSEAELVASDTDNLCPQLVLKPSGGLGVVWDKLVDGSPRPAWSERLGQGWSPPLLLPINPGTLVRYPSATGQSDTRIVVTWSERSASRAAVGMQFLECNPDQPARLVSQVALEAGQPPSLVWTSTPGVYYSLERSTNLTQNAWAKAGTPVLARELTTRATDPNGGSATAGFYRVVQP